VYRPGNTQTKELKIFTRNRRKLLQIGFALLFSALACNLPVAQEPLADALQQSANTFIGPGVDWFDPDNWSNGSVPTGNNAAVVFQSNSELVIFHQQVEIQKIDVSEGNISLVSGCLKIKERLQSAPVPQGNLQANPAGGIVLNPSCVSAESINLENTNAILDLGFWGGDPAVPGSTGPGHFAHIDVDQIELGGQLELSFYYGFQPEPGQVFEIISVEHARTGEFANAAEGDLVGGYCDVGLRLSYQGGDGDDVVLAAERTPDRDWPCPLTAISGNWSDLLSWEDGKTPAEEDSVLLQSGSDLVIPDEYVVIQDVVVTDGSLSLVSGCLKTKGSLQLGSVFQEQESAQSGPVLMGGMDLNPSCVIAETFVQNSGMVLDVGLGGPDPARPRSLQSFRCQTHPSWRAA